jgi:uncharacterized protein (DUF2147 family)
MSPVLFRTLIFGIALLGGPNLASAQQPSAAGLWEQIDETSGKPEGWFRISEEAGFYKGILVKGFPKPGEDPATWKCEKCEGAEKNAPVIGLTLIKNMKRNGLSYEDGTITDPRNGSVYRALMQLRPDGMTLEVRGYLGIALFGRTQVWNRLPDTAMDPPASQPNGQSKAAPPAAKKAAPVPKKQ